MANGVGVREDKYQPRVPRRPLFPGHVLVFRLKISLHFNALPFSVALFSECREKDR